MKLLLKFNLVFLLVFGIGTAASAWLSLNLLERNARAEIAAHARLLMDTSLAARSYTSTQINPLLETQMKYTFLPQSVPAYAATELFNDLRKKHGEYNYNEAVLNPTNPRNRAVDWESDVVARFRGGNEIAEMMGERDTPTGKSFYVARPIKITNGACLRCHSTVDAAPKTMIERYGSANGFGWTMNEVVGAQIVSVPTAVPLQRARDAFKLFMSSIGAVFVAIIVLLNLMLWAMVIRPITQLSGMADRVSLGDLDAPEYKRNSSDEVGVLAQAIGRMRTSLVHAMKMLDG